MGEQSLKRKHKKYIKLMGKANSIGEELLKEFKLVVSFQEIKSLLEAVEENGTDYEKEKYRLCYENYNNNILTIFDYEIHNYCKSKYGELTRESKIKKEIIDGIAMGE